MKLAHTPPLANLGSASSMVGAHAQSFADIEVGYGWCTRSHLPQVVHVVPACELDALQRP